MSIAPCWSSATLAYKDIVSISGLSAISDHVCGRRVRQSASKLAPPLHLPTHFIELLFLIEDKRFSFHFGIDPFAMARAAVNNLSGGRLQGASTITQQLYDVVQTRDSATYGRDRTISRKARQVTWACLTEMQYRKDAILGSYLRNVYWGRNYFGLTAASWGYFKSDAKSLSVAESFFLTERLANPNAFFPARFDSLLARPAIRNVLERETGSIGELRELYSVWL